MRSVTVLALVILLNLPARSHDRCPKAECEEVKQKISLVRSKVRQGYTRATGEKLQERLRKLRAIRAKKMRSGSVRVRALGL